MGFPGRSADKESFYTTGIHNKCKSNFLHSTKVYSDGKESRVAQIVKNPPVGDLGSILGLGRSLEEGMATYASILAWRNPWTEESGGLQSTGLQRVGHD